MGSWLGQRILDALVFIATDLKGAYGQALWNGFSKLFSSPIAVLEDRWVRFLIEMAMTIAIGALPVLITYHAVRRVLESLDGQSTTPPEVLVRRSLQAGAALTGVALYGWFAGTLADHAREVLGALPFKVSFLEVYFIPIDMSSGLAGLLLALVFLCCAGVVVIQRAILAAEFTVLMVVGAFLALQKIGDESPQGWQLWKREVTAISLTPVLQLLTIYLFAIRLKGVGATLTLAHWLEAFAMLYLLWNTPRWARQFTYSTGMGHTSAGAGAAAARLVAIRWMLKK